MTLVLTRAVWTFSDKTSLSKKVYFLQLPAIYSLGLGELKRSVWKEIEYKQNYNKKNKRRKAKAANPGEVDMVVHKAYETRKGKEIRIEFEVGFL